MANIKIELGHPVIDGMPLSFRAPCNCNEVSGVKVEWPDGEDSHFIEFTFADAHGNDLTGLGNLFSKDAMVRVILDATNAKAYIQNADTNAYLEQRLANAGGPGGLGQLEVIVDMAEETASHSSTEIIAHLDAGGTAVMVYESGSFKAYVPLYMVMGPLVVFRENHPDGETATYIDYTIRKDKSCSTYKCGAVPSQIDFSNFDNGSFTETVDGEVVTHSVTFDSQGRPTAIDGTTIVWGSA